MRSGDDLRVADVVREHAARRGDTIAVRHGARALTYAALDERSNRLARALLDAGRPRRLAHRVPRSHRAGAGRAALRGEQDRSGRRPAQLAPRSARAPLGRGRRRAPRARGGPDVRRPRRGARRSSVEPARAGRRGRRGTRLRGAARRAGADRPRRARRTRRRRPPAVHVRHDGRSQGRPHDAQEPDRSGRDVAALGVRRRLGEPHAAPAVPHRRHRLGVPRPLERRDDDPRERVRAPSACSSSSSATA